MADLKTIRINKVLRELNISLDRAVEHLSEKGFQVEARPTAKISQQEYDHLLDAFQTDRSKREASHEAYEEKRKEKEAIREQSQKEDESKPPAPKAPAPVASEPVKPVAPKSEPVVRAQATLSGLKTVGKIDLTPKPTPKKAETKKTEVAPKKAEKKEAAAPVVKEAAPVVKETAPAVPDAKPEPTAENSDKIQTQYKKLSGLKATGQTIDLNQFKKSEPKKSADSDNKRRRKRITKDTGPGNRKPAQNRGGQKQQRPAVTKEEPTEEEIQKQIRETLEKLQGKTSKSKGAKYRREKRDSHRLKTEEEEALQEAESKILKVTEFVTVGEVATMMDVSSTQIISACMTLGIMVTMNQRLDAETLSVVAEEFGYEVEFITAEIEEAQEVVIDNP